MKTLNHIDRHVGGRLRALRESRGMDVQVLSRMLGISAARLVGLEAGDERISAELMRKLSRVLRAAPTEFFAGLSQGGGEVEKKPAIAVSPEEQQKKLVADFARIRDPKSRDIILAMVAAYAELSDLDAK